MAVYKTTVTAPATYPNAASPNVVLPFIPKRIMLVNKEASTDTTKIAYASFGPLSEDHWEGTPGNPSAGVVFVEQRAKSLWIRGDNAPKVLVIAEG